MVSNEKENTKKNDTFISMKYFLENIPPNTWKNISNIFDSSFLSDMKVVIPDIKIHCPQKECNGNRFYEIIDEDDPWIQKNEFNFVFLHYQCCNCRKMMKTFSLAIIPKENRKDGECIKLGELPNYGPPLPPKLVKLIGPDREDFLKGRRCENQGLGVGAFIYYRRVVENQKKRIFEDIIKVSRKIGASKERIEVIEQAIQENQFRKSLEMTKDVIPESLLIDGHNPLLLLHSALSKGVHQQNDAECLSLASSIRTVLVNLSEKLAIALKEEKELKQAISTLMNINNVKKKN